MESSRKRRLIEAMEIGAVPPQIDASLILALENVAAKQQKLLQLQEQQQQSANNRAKTDLAKRLISMEMKMKVIENWEVTKLKAIERLALEVEALQEIEEAIERREQVLTSEAANTDSADLVAPKRPRLSNEPSVHTGAVRKSAGARKSAMPKQIAAWMDSDADDVVIGPNGTTVSKAALNAINWSLSGAAVTRKILMEVFDRQTLAFHTLTGKPSPAFMDCDKPLKHQLDPAKVADIVHVVTENLNMTPKEVRASITTKCADENKMFRLREKKRQSLQLKDANESVELKNANASKDKGQP